MTGSLVLFIATLIMLHYFVFVCVLSLGCPGYRLSVPVQVIDYRMS